MIKKLIINIGITLLLLLVGHSVALGQYCERVFRAGPTNKLRITRVQFAGIDQYSGLWTSYEDFTWTKAQVAAGETHEIRVAVPAVFGIGPAPVAVYFDWNGDGDFVDAGEFYEFALIELANVYGGPVVVPQNAKLGETRMRVIAYDRGAPSGASPCQSEGGWTMADVGQVEDYTVNIRASANPIPPVVEAEPPVEADDDSDEQTDDVSGNEPEDAEEIEEIVLVGDRALRAYPNPMVHTLTVVGPSEPSYVLYRYDGNIQAVDWERAAADNYQIDVSGLASARYLLVEQRTGQRFALLKP